MHYCPNCGTEIQEGTRFCSGCGHELLSTAPAVTPAAPRSRSTGNKRLHCPNCRSTALSPVVETEISGGTSVNHSFSRKNSVSSFDFKNTHRNYWMCGECGQKFRNLQNLEEELANLKKITRNAAICTIALAVLGLILGVTIGWLILLLWSPLLLIIVVCIFVNKNKIQKMESERMYLKRNCFG